MGPACHPLCTIKLSFLELFLAPHIFSLAFFFRSHATFETLRNLLAHGTRMSSSMCYKSLFSWVFFHPLIFGYFFFLSISCHVWNVDDAAGSWVPDVSLPVQETCDILIILQTINSVFRSELLQTEKNKSLLLNKQTYMLNLLVFCFCEA